MDNRRANEAAPALLNSTESLEGYLLSRLYPPPGGQDSSSWVDELYSAAKSSAEKLCMGAWETVGFMMVHGFGFFVEDESFVAEKQSVSEALPEAHARWLCQWARPEIWLAALLGVKDQARLQAILVEIQSRKDSIAEEPLAALMWVLLESASNAAYEQERQNGQARSHGELMAPAWHSRAEMLAEYLLKTDAGLALAIDMLTLGSTARDVPKHLEVRKQWHVALARKLPRQGLDALIGKLECKNQVFRLGIVNSAALVAYASTKAREELAKSVLEHVKRIPLSEWVGRERTLAGDSATLDTAQLLGKLLSTLPDRAGTWLALWEAVTPGPSDGWPVDLKNWRERRTATAFIECIGLFAGSAADGRPHTGGYRITDEALIQLVRKKLVKRLDESAGDYGEMDGVVMRLVWVIGVHAECLSENLSGFSAIGLDDQ